MMNREPPQSNGVAIDDKDKGRVDFESGICQNSRAGMYVYRGRALQGSTLNPMPVRRSA